MISKEHLNCLTYVSHNFAYSVMSDPVSLPDLAGFCLAHLQNIWFCLADPAELSVDLPFLPTPAGETSPVLPRSQCLAISLKLNLKPWLRIFQGSQPLQIMLTLQPVAVSAQKYHLHFLNLTSTKDPPLILHLTSQFSCKQSTSSATPYPKWIHTSEHWKILHLPCQISPSDL